MNGYEPLLRAFAHAADEVLVEVDVFDVEGDEFTGAHSGSVHELEDRAVADRLGAGACGYGQKGVDLFHGESLGEGSSDAGGGEVVHRVGIYHSFVEEESEQGFCGGDLAGFGGVGVSAFVEIKYE